MNDFGASVLGAAYQWVMQAYPIDMADEMAGVRAADSGLRHSLNALIRTIDPPRAVSVPCKTPASAHARRRACLYRGFVLII
jgi:hypothetical protein